MKRSLFGFARILFVLVTLSFFAGSLQADPVVTFATGGAGSSPPEEHDLFWRPA